MPHSRVQVPSILVMLTGFALFLLMLMSIPLGAAQDQNEGTTATPMAAPIKKGIDFLFNYLNMAGTKKSTEFQPLSQRERTRIYAKTMINPLGFVKAGLSAGLDQWKDKPEEWEQGGSGYGKRFANILGQYSIQRTVTFGLSSALHEDNRYFNSGKHGVWPRTGYALASGFLARHDDGSRSFSISQVGGVAAGAFLSRLWQPASQGSAANGAVSFGLTMASNAGFSILKEFLPDIGRALTKERKRPSSNPQGNPRPCR